MSRFKLIAGLMIGMVGLLSASCSSEDDPVTSSEKTSMVFHLGLDMQSRAAQTLNPSLYDTKLYLYEGDEANGYSFVKEVKIESSSLELTDLSTKSLYKAVFLAVPKDQKPELPTFKSDIIPSYDKAIADYIEDLTEGETNNDIYRSIVSFKPSTTNVTQSTVLTRQNGALEVRIKNVKDMTSVKLHVKGYTKMYLNDGTGGQVITAGNTVDLSKTVTEELTASEVRVRINLLPVEDLTDVDGTNFLQITTASGETRYPLKSDQKMIPIYPNQVTWLTFGNGSGDFKVSFSGSINVEDDVWDGWNVVNNNTSF